MSNKIPLEGSKQAKYTTWGIFSKKEVKQEYKNAVEKAAEKILLDIGSTSRQVSLKELRDKYHFGKLRVKDVYKAIDVQYRYDLKIDKYTSVFARILKRKNPFYEEAVEYCAKLEIQKRKTSPEEMNNLKNQPLTSLQSSQHLKLKDVDKKIKEILQDNSKKASPLPNSSSEKRNGNDISHPGNLVALRANGGGLRRENSSVNLSLSSSSSPSLKEKGPFTNDHLLEFLNDNVYESNEWQVFYETASAKQVGQFIKVYSQMKQDGVKNIIAQDALQLVDLKKFSSDELNEIFCTRDLDILPNLETFLDQNNLPLSPNVKENIYLYAAENEKVAILQKLDIDCPQHEAGKTNLSIGQFCRKPITIQYIVDRYEAALPAELKKNSYDEKTVNRIIQLFDAWEILHDFKTSLNEEQKLILQKIEHLLQQVDIKKLNFTSETMSSLQTIRNIFLCGAHLEKLDFLEKSLEIQPLAKIMPDTRTRANQKVEWIDKLLVNSKNRSLKYLIMHDKSYFNKLGGEYSLKGLEEKHEWNTYFYHSTNDSFNFLKEDLQSKRDWKEIILHKKEKPVTGTAEDIYTISLIDEDSKKSTIYNLTEEQLRDISIFDVKELKKQKVGTTIRMPFLNK